MSVRNEWQRVRGSHRTRDIGKGLQARIADPLWMLARQWQFGEFKGEDAASPAKVQLKYGSLNVNHIHSLKPDGMPGPAHALEPDILLEAVLERETVSSGPAAIRMSAEAGIQFLRKIPNAQRQNLLKVLQQKYPLPKPTTVNLGKKNLLRILEQASFHAHGFSKATENELNKLASQAGLGSSVLKAAFEKWLSYYRGRFSEPQAEQKTWQKDRLEYRFSVSAQQGEDIRIQLGADEYPGGRLDWYSFDFDKAHTKGLDTKLEQTAKHWLIPTPIRYSGMPADRFWNFEDGKVSFGGLSAGATDLAQLILTEFATVYSNDWYMLPLPVQTGSLSRLISMRVWDSFGERHDIQSAAVNDGMNRVWRFFELKEDPSVTLGKGLSPWLFIPRTILGGLEDRPVEKVVFSRDEMANLAWGIEETLEGASGHRVSRKTQWMKRRAEVQSYLGEAETVEQTEDTELSEQDDSWKYRLLSIVPPYWIPFIPEVLEGKITNRLLRGRMGEWDLIGDLKQELAGVQGEIMDASAPMAIQEEEIVRGGIEVSRSYQAARDIQGRLVIWAGRRKRPASGNRASGREMDTMDLQE